ncbi:MAG: LPS assembly protein LptD [Bryobacteraceae bacterium]
MVRVPRINEPGPNEVYVRGEQRATGPWIYIRGANSSVETASFLLRADEIDYNQDTNYAEARGNVRFLAFDHGEELMADRVEYYLKEHRGKFYRVRGTSKPAVGYRPGLLITNAPFYFEGKWAERLGDRYVVHEGFITNCRVPGPLWHLQAHKFDILPGQQAIASKAYFRVYKIPLFFTPYFYKSLESEPRKSGLLMPIFGNSARRGKWVKVGYYWAINRSYDATYVSQYFTERGFAHIFDVRGKPTDKIDFDANLFGINDRGLLQSNGDRIKQGGFITTLREKADLPRGWTSRAEIRYLSSFTFRQNFTESFSEAVASEVHSRGYVAKTWSTYGLGIIFERDENYQSNAPGDKVVLRKLPEVMFTSRDRQVVTRALPIWVSLESSAGLVRRNEPLFQTRQFVDRLDFAPRVMTAARWKGFSLIPSFGIRETHWGSSIHAGSLSGQGVLRSSREFSLELIPPSLGRIFDKTPGWLGDKIKHVIEPRAGFRYVDGIGNFDQLVRFDETELLTNTKEFEYSITNRFFAKRGSTTTELLSWQVWQKRYLDPNLGGAVVAGQRNVFATQEQMTGYAFFDQARRYSPIVSSLRMNPTGSLGVEWRTDYDPLRQRFSNSAIMGSWRWDKYSIIAGHNLVRSNQVLSPSANQLIAMAGWGKQHRRGWNVGFQSVYDFRQQVMQFITTQVAYNTDCCGLSMQFRRFSFGTISYPTFQVSFAVANIGSVGTLRQEERIF